VTQTGVILPGAQRSGAEPSIVAVKENISATLDRSGATLTRETAEPVRAAVRVEDVWSLLRRSGGVSAMPQGDGATAARSLVRSLSGLGLHVVPVGELERWGPEIPGRGPSWVSAALEAHVHEREGAHATFPLDVTRGF